MLPRLVTSSVFPLSTCAPVTGAASRGRRKRRIADKCKANDALAGNDVTEKHGLAMVRSLSPRSVPTKYDCKGQRDTCPQLSIQRSLVYCIAN